MADTCAIAKHPGDRAGEPGRYSAPNPGRGRRSRRDAGRPVAIHGLDTSFLVAAAVKQQAEHTDARDTLTRLLQAGDFIAIALQVLAEFIHIVTDPRRFARPLDMKAARQVAEQWWTAREVVRVFPDDAATRQFLSWLEQFSLGRKRLLDTLLAATYLQAGISSLLTTNPADFGVFGAFACITPKRSATNP